MSKPVRTIGNVRDDIPPRDTTPADAKLVIAAWLVLTLSFGLCAWARWGL